MENARSFHERFRVDELSNEYYRSSELSVMKKTSENSCSYTINDCCTSLEHFIFPPPPHLEVPPGDPERKCFNNKEGSPSSSDDVDSNSDSSQSDNFPLVGNSGCLKSSKNAIFKLRGYFNDFNSPVSNILSMLPPIGVFWDIENCQVPKGRSAVVIAQAIRDKFFHGYRETEFLVVCDVKKENSQVIQELNDAQVNLIHVSSQSKNAADDKLRQAMRRFADIHGPPAAIMLISGDINFSSDLCDLRHRKKIHVILLHNDLCSQSLILCANEHHNYSKLVETLPLRGSENLQSNNPVEVLVTNLPLGYDPAKIRNKLKRLSENCGGRVGIITDQTTTIRFSSMEFATRAQKRMNRERVFGNSVFVSTPYNVTDDQDFNKIYGRKPNFCKSAEHNSVVTNNKIYHFSNSENFVPIPPDYTMNATKYTLFHDKCPCPYPNGNHKENTSPPWLHPRIPPNRTEITDAVSRPILRPRDQNTPLLPNPCHGGVIQIHSWPFEPVKILPRPPVSVNVSDMDRRCFHPISSSSPVELHITNLDQNMDLAELRKSLLNAFSEFTTVLNLSVYVQSDGNYAASIRVRSQQDAQFVISRLHRQKIGYKRIMISYAHNGNGHNIALIRSQTISLLSDVPGNQLPFIKFRELYEKRFLFSPNASDFNKIRDVCTISNEANGRIISLKEEFRNSPSPLLSLNNDNAVPIEQSFCNKHWKPTKINNDKGWAELEVMTLPNVKIELASFSKNLHHLVSSHSNYLLLTSLCDCYEAEYGTLVFDDNGVPLEHLVTCVSGLELVTNNNTGIKYITSAVARASLDDRKSEGSHSLQDGNHCISPSLASNLALFSRELVDLLKTFPHCMMSFNRFIPAYHHHFGRQCRVADYGYTKLIDLMEALPNVVQVIGEGNRRMMTLAHKAQIRRFTSDLLRVLKSLASKQTTIGEFPTLFEKTMNRVFDPIDYGLCYLEDLLSQISENTIVINPPSGADENYDRSNTVIAIPKREQTAEEIEKTKVFATEVIELLSHAPQCSMLFNKFIPAYHHHYGHQCKVADFGFTKLIELFEAIPDIVKIEEDIEGGDRKVTLREEVKLKVLGEQLVSLVMSHRPNELSLANLSSVFLWQYGYSLKPSAYGFQSLEELIQNLNFAVKVVNTPSGAILQAIDKNQLKFLSLKTKRVLIERSQTGKMLFKEFSKAFAAMFGETIELQIIENELSNAITVIRNDNVGDSIIKLNPLEMFARDVYWLMLMSNGRLPLNSFENTYLSMYGTAVQPAVYGFQTLPALLQAIPHTIVIRGKPPKRLILLNSDLASVGFRFPKSLITTNRAAPHPVGEENIPCVTLPVLTLHPDVYNVTTELTSPVKILNNAIFAEQMLHAPVSGIETPSPFRVPFPGFLNGYNSSNSSSGQFHDCRSNQNGTTASSDGCNYIAQNSEISADDQPTSESMESSTDSFSDGTVSSTNKRKIRLAAQFQGYSES